MVAFREWETVFPIAQDVVLIGGLMEVEDLVLRRWN